MPTSTDVTNLKINELTEAQYDTAVQGGVIGENELSVLTDLDDAIQVSSMPTASAGELGKVYQFIGTTDANYTHGYFYECVSDGQPTPTYSWTQVNVQPAVDPLPSQSGNSGKFLTTDGTDASWSNTVPTIALKKDAYTTYPMYIHGTGAKQMTISNDSNPAYAGFKFIDQPAGAGIKFEYTGSSASSPKGVLGSLDCPWASATINKIFTKTLFNGADITVPTTGGTMALLSDIPSGPVVPSTMPELTVAGWSNNTQTVTVTGVTATNTVFVSPAPASASDYASAGIVCTAQGTDSLTFTCTTVPTNAITVNVVIMG